MCSCMSPWDRNKPNFKYTEFYKLLSRDVSDKKDSVHESLKPKKMEEHN